MTSLQEKFSSYLEATARAARGAGVTRRVEELARRKLGARVGRLADLRDLAPLELVHLAYLVLLRRPIDPGSLSGWEARVRAGDFELGELIYQLVHSAEFKKVNRVPFIRMVHRARVAWVETLGAFDSILDIAVHRLPTSRAA